jgi:hypothetical protein
MTPKWLNNSINQTVGQLVMKSLCVIESKGSLACSQQHATEHYVAADESRQHLNYIIISRIRPLGLFRFRIYFSETYESTGQLVGLLGPGDRPNARPLPTHRTTQHRETRRHIHASSGIRTHDHSVQAAEDSTCLRPLGHWDRHLNSI